MIARPQAEEYGSYHAGYVQRVPEETDLFALLRRQPKDLRSLLERVTDTQANARPAPGEWSVKEVIGHICDSERVFGYRALHIARGDTTPLALYDQDAYVLATDFNARSLRDLLDEFAALRQANVLTFSPMGIAELERRGTVNEQPYSVRGLLYVMAGHVMHHVESLKTDYKVG